MKRRYKLLLLILGIIALALTFVDTRHVDGWVKESIIEAARGGGALLSITSLRTRIIGAEAEDIVLAFPKVWTSLRITSANSSLSLAQILT